MKKLPLAFALAFGLPTVPGVLLGAVANGKSRYCLQ